MRFGGRSWWRLALPGALVVLSAGSVWAQDTALPGGEIVTPPVTPPKLTPGPADETSAAPPGEANPAPAVDSLSPMRLMDGPSLRETGRIAVAPAPQPMNLIENEETLKSPKETRTASAIEIAPAPARWTRGFIDPRVLDREVADKFTQIAACRVDVARSKQVTPSQIVADTLLLRWIIERDGSTGSTEVVATAPIDLGVMDCAKRVMSQWRFTAPRGGAKAVERSFTFSGNVPPAAAR
jgi:hypothetical protein